MNGIQATRQIREQAPSVRVLVLTTYDADEWVFDAIRAGPARYLLKGLLENGRKNRDFWTAKNGCDATASTPVSPSPTVEYGGCDGGFPVRYCEYDGDHYLPSYAPKGIWDFFKAL